jgi:hypothetical protein
VLQPAGADAGRTLLVFLRLLETGTEPIAKRRLAHRKHYAGHTIADVSIDGVCGVFWYHFSPLTTRPPTRAALAFPKTNDVRGRSLVFQDCSQMIRLVKFVLVQRHDPRQERTIKRSVTAMELEYAVGFVNGDDFPDSVNERTVGNAFVFGNCDECAGSEFFR